MNEQKEKIINRTSVIIQGIEKAVYYFRNQNNDAGLRTSAFILDSLGLWMEEAKEENLQLDWDELQINLQCLLDAQLVRDYVLLADYYETLVNAFLYPVSEYLVTDMADCIFGKEELLFEKNRSLVLISEETPAAITKGRYEIEYTSSGLKTAAVLADGTKKYLHSNKNPQMEAFMLAREWYHPDAGEYVIYGWGLLYHIRELCELDPTVPVFVYETDYDMIIAALRTVDLSWLKKYNQVHLIYDPYGKKLSEHLRKDRDGMEVRIYYPSLSCIKNKEMRSAVEEYFLSYSSEKSQGRLLNSNFRRNIKQYDKAVDELKGDFEGKDLYIVAAGPSLDKNFMQLKQIDREKGIILATGTVFSKLLQAGIEPDYFIVTDANERIYNQISGIEELKIPMIFLSTACYYFSERYKGTRYIMFQKDYPKAEIFAEKNGYQCFRTGGSVSTAAFDLGIGLGCRRIIFLGLDLAHTGNIAHASHTSRRESVDEKNLLLVKDINGNHVPTTPVLNIFRKWFERRIAGLEERNKVDIIDATEGGAIIEGMQVMKLEEAIK